MPAPLRTPGKLKSATGSPPPKPTAAPAPRVPPAPPVSSEPGWLPDFVYTGDKFESGLAFFADGLGRITRFSREPADLASARRLPGQAALPGLINTHSLSWHRVFRARGELPGRGGGDRGAVDAVSDRVRGAMTPDDVFEAARMAFTEMLLSGITSVGEFHAPPRAGEDAAACSDAVLRAAHEVGLRIGLLAVAPDEGAAVDAFLRQAEQLRSEIAARYAADEAWLGVAAANVGSLPLPALKAIGNYAHSQRFRLHARVAVTKGDAERAAAALGRPALCRLADEGLLDKRFTAIHGGYLVEAECRALGAARASLCVCPISEQRRGLAPAPVEALLAGGSGVALGTAENGQIDLLKDARVLEYGLRGRLGQAPAIGADCARTLFHAATVTGARSLGATGGGLEVGRPADFFTVNLYEPSIAGADADTLLPNIVFGLERRAIREVWIGARQRVSGGRHPNQGLIVGRFVEMQRRLWSA